MRKKSAPLGGSHPIVFTCFRQLWQPKSFKTAQLSARETVGKPGLLLSIIDIDISCIATLHSHKQYHGFGKFASSDVCLRLQK